MKPTVVKCPICGKPVEWTPEQTWRPFCSERCRLIDLGDWVDERHRIPGDSEMPGGTSSTSEPADD